MSQVSVIAKITAKEGMRDELITALQFGLDNAADEPGTLVYVLHTDSGDANVLWFYETYTDQDALLAHSGAAWFKELGPKIGPFMAGRPELSFLTPVAGKGLAG